MKLEVNKTNRSFPKPGLAISEIEIPHIQKRFRQPHLAQLFALQRELVSPSSHRLCVVPGEIIQTIQSETLFFSGPNAD